MKLLMNQTVRVFFVAGCVAGGLHGDDLLDLDPVYSVSSPVVEQSVFRPTGKIALISSETLEALDANDLTAAIRRVPGVIISRYNVVGAYGGSDGGGIFIRGHGSGRPGSDITTMIDGVPLYVGVWSHPLVDTLSIDLADAVEVIKSPQPAVVGNMGFAAVNLIPKVAQQEGLHGEVEGAVGRFNTTLLRGQVAHQGESAGWLLSASRRSSDGHRRNADGRTQAAYGSAGYRLSKHWKLSLLGSLTDSVASDPEPVGLTLPIVEQYATQHGFVLGKLEYEGEDLDFALKLHLEDGEGSWLQWHQPPPAPFQPQQLTSVTRYRNYGLKSHLSGYRDALFWKVGLDLDRAGGSLSETYAASPDAVFDEEIFTLLSPSLFLEQVIALGSSSLLRLSGGVRSSHHAVFDDAWSGQVGMQLHSGPLRTYLQLSRSVNYPGVYVSVFGRRGPPWQVGGNWRDLDPERIDHVEFGVEWELNRNLVVNGAVFHDSVDDSIRLIQPPPAGFILNQGGYSTSGVEAMLQYRLGKGSLFAGGTWMESDDTVPNLPQYSAIVGFHQDLGPWMFSCDLQHIASQYTFNPRFSDDGIQIDGYHLLSAKIAYRVKSGPMALQYYVIGENLTNESYMHRMGYPMPGVSFRAGIKAAW